MFTKSERNKIAHRVAALVVRGSTDDRFIAGIRHTQSNEALDLYLPTGADENLVNVLDRVGGRKVMDAQHAVRPAADVRLQFAQAVAQRNVTEKLRGERRVIIDFEYGHAA